MTVNVTIVFAATIGLSFVSERVEQVEVLDLGSDCAVDFTGAGAAAAHEWVATMNEVTGSKRYAVMIDGGWA